MKTFRLSGKLPCLTLMGVASPISLSCRSVRDLAEDPTTEVHVCKLDLWRDAANRFPDLSVE